MTTLGAGSSDVLQHLLLDRAIKVGIVVVALGILALGMRAIWRRASRPPRAPRP
ncbi:hypothetical protein GCM10022403_049880 [Streptomyces coacervatus]|uniref:Uncharacterized protein n=1 Tax=Streptomyces coacervatus TaxID=647381 RepID=A0ABP7I476_9ACTN|nr:hypothetical protein [Streptomyces coacervatus]MDF2266166.1 hypothetical protein [Streptomyces coacervatus]